MCAERCNMEIPIHTDAEGFNLLKCPNCGAMFKVTPSDFEDEGVLELFCPSCGLTSKNYATDDVIELATVMAQNKAVDLIFDACKKMERQFNKSMIAFKAGKPPRQKPENPIRSGV